MIAVAGRLVVEAHHDYLAETGLTPASFVALGELAGGPLAQGELADKAGVEQQTMSRTVDRMERDGLVVREPDPADRRRTFIVRTAEGAAAYQVAAARSDALVAKVQERLDEPDRLRAELVKVLETLGVSRYRKQG
jgi:DNA-binding MarR family transcriptional regulator